MNQGNANTDVFLSLPHYWVAVEHCGYCSSVSSNKTGIRSKRKSGRQTRKFFLKQSTFIVNKDIKKQNDRFFLPKQHSFSINSYTINVIQVAEKWKLQ